MTARVLIVDDIPTNVKLLEARLLAEYFEVVTASSGAQAIEICRSQDIDIVLLDVMMPEMDGFTCCQILKRDAVTAHIPIVMITALDQPSDRVRGLEAGADDFLTKPVDDVQLLARVKSLARLKGLGDELRARSRTSHELALEDTARTEFGIAVDAGRILVIDTERARAERIEAYLRNSHKVTILVDPSEAVFQMSGGDYELAIVSMALEGFDPLRICSQIRTVRPARCPLSSLPRTRIARRWSRRSIWGSMISSCGPSSGMSFRHGSRPRSGASAIRSSCVRASIRQWPWR